MVTASNGQNGVQTLDPGFWNNTVVKWLLIASIYWNGLAALIWIIHDISSYFFNFDTATPHTQGHSLAACLKYCTLLTFVVVLIHYILIGRKNFYAKIALRRNYGYVLIVAIVLGSVIMGLATKPGQAAY